MRRLDWQSEELNLKEAVNKSSRPGYLAIDISEEFIKQVEQKNQIRCYGVEKAGDISSGKGVKPHYIKEYEDDFENKRTLLFSISELMNYQFSENVKELIVKVEGREVCRRRIEPFPCNYFG